MNALALELVARWDARLHFVGIAGSGMSALAQYRALGGGLTSGSDRALDRGQQGTDRALFERLGVTLFPQDGSGVLGAAALVTSTAVEAEIPDLAAARAAGIPVLHRAELLGAHVRREVSAAVAGTSGKSTVTTMLFEILRHAGRDPGLVSGGDALCLRDTLVRGQEVRGNAWRGLGPLVVEADESDGSLVQHAPEVGIVLNLHRDHIEPAEVLSLFRDFLARTRGVRIVGDEPECRELQAGAMVTGFSNEATFRGVDLALDGRGARFKVRGVTVELPLPGAHNANNALAAMAAAEALGVNLRDSARALAHYRGVARRFEIVGEKNGIRVIDDYAHNPRKLAAALAAAQASSARVFALFQPHGFGPSRFMRDELAALIPTRLRPEDRWYFAPIHDAGGTARRDISAADLAEDFCTRGAPAAALAHRDEFPALVRREARRGDAILILGGRDNSLAELARSALKILD